jgi:hypothetical protein
LALGQRPLRIDLRCQAGCKLTFEPSSNRAALRRVASSFEGLIESVNNRVIRERDRSRVTNEVRSERLRSGSGEDRPVNQERLSEKNQRGAKRRRSTPSPFTTPMASTISSMRRWRSLTAKLQSAERSAGPARHCRSDFLSQFLY